MVHSAALFLQMAMMGRKNVKIVRRSNDVKQVVKSILNARIEHKRTALVFSVNSAAAGAITPVTQGIVQGDDLNQRSGSQIILERLKLVMTSSAFPAGVVESRLRVILFIDHLNTGTIPAITEVLTAATPDDAYQPSGQSANRFKILGDWFMLTARNNGGAALSGLPAIVSKDQTWKLKDKVQYNAATNVAGANGKGAMFMIFLDVGTQATYHVAINLTYSDA